jgi:predicted RNase H-like nuclease (RuvC/YqgF family)
MNEKAKRFFYTIFLLISFFCGCVFTGLVICRQRPGTSGDLDSRYAIEHGRAAEIIGRLDRELEQEREYNRELRNHNLRARELTEGLTDTIGRLEGELERELEYNRELRNHNLRARELAEGLTGTAERNVRNLQDAVSFISEIRAKLKVLAEFYSNSSTGSGDD